MLLYFYSITELQYLFAKLTVGRTIDNWISTYSYVRFGLNKKATEIDRQEDAQEHLVFVLDKVMNTITNENKQNTLKKFMTLDYIGIKTCKICKKSTYVFTYTYIFLVLKLLFICIFQSQVQQDRIKIYDITIKIKHS